MEKLELEVKKAFNEIFSNIRMTQYNVFKEKILDKRKTVWSIKWGITENMKIWGTCYFKEGIIFFNFQRLLNPNLVFAYKYFLPIEEKEYVERNCVTKFDCLVWLACHEWQHLYKGSQNHEPQFYKDVEQLYILVKKRLAFDDKKLNYYFPNLVNVSELESNFNSFNND